jgi:GntR family transcriptional regulator
LIEARYGLRVAEIRLNAQAVNTSAELATRLQRVPGTAALEIVRRYFDSSGIAFEVSVSVHPADRFSVSMRLKRSEV